MFNARAVYVVYVRYMNLIIQVTCTQGKADAPWNFQCSMWACLLALGFIQDAHEKPLWVRGLGSSLEVHVLAFCDDIIVAANCDKAHNEFETQFNKRWGDCGFKLPDYMLGYDVEQTATTFRLTAATKINMILEENGMLNCSPTPTPFPENRVIDVRDCPEPAQRIKLPFRHVLGQLQYINYACRPTIAYNVAQLARVQNNPSMGHWKALMHVVKYLAGTRRAGVQYSAQPASIRCRLAAYSDSSWADIPGGMGDPRVVDGRKSTLGHVLMLNGGPIMWKAHVSKIVALSSAEAELFATKACAKHICEARRILETCGSVQAPTPTTLWCDSSSVVSINNKRNTSTKLRHLEINWFFCRHLAEAGIIATKKIPGEDNPADLFTKSLGISKFRKFSMMLEQAQQMTANFVTRVSAAFHRNVRWY